MHTIIASRSSTFALGTLCCTRGAMDLLHASGQSASTFLQRHARGDWGDLCPEDQQANQRALERGGRILSAYTLANSHRLYIITEADRSVTTLLLPSEY